MTLTKNDLATTLYDKGLFLQKESAEFIELILEEIKTTLESSESVKISGFGKFMVSEKQQRIGRNPKTGDEHVIEPRKVVTWSPADKLRKVING